MPRSPAFGVFGIAAFLGVAGLNGQAPAAPAATITLPATITCVSAIHESSSVAAGLSDGRVAVWDGHGATPSIMLKPHTAPVAALATTGDGRFLWSAATDGTLARTPIAPGAESTLRRVDLGSAPTRAGVFSADGSLIVTGGEFGELRVYDTTSGTLTQQLRGHRTEVQSLTVRPGSAIIASASAEADLRIWDAASGREISFIDGSVALFALAFSPRDGTLAAGGANRRLTLRDRSTFKPVREITLQPPRMVNTLTWSPDGRLIALGDVDDQTLSKGGVQLLDAATLATVATLDTGGKPPGSIVFADKAALIVGALGRDLRAWTVAAPDRIQ